VEPDDIDGFALAFRITELAGSSVMLPPADVFEFGLICTPLSVPTPAVPTEAAVMAIVILFEASVAVPASVFVPVNVPAVQNVHPEGAANVMVLPFANRAGADSVNTKLFTLVVQVFVPVLAFVARFTVPNVIGVVIATGRCRLSHQAQREDQRESDGYAAPRESLKGNQNSPPGLIQK